MKNRTERYTQLLLLFMLGVLLGHIIARALEIYCW